MSDGVFQVQGGPEFAANYLERYTGRRVSLKTLERWRENGKGPAYTKVGRAIVYERVDLDHWIASNRRTSTKCHSPSLASGIPAVSAFSTAVSDELTHRGMRGIPVSREQIVELLECAVLELRSGTDVSPAFDRLVAMVMVWLEAFSKAFLTPGASSNPAELASEAPPT